MRGRWIRRRPTKKRSPFEPTDEQLEAAQDAERLELEELERDINRWQAESRGWSRRGRKASIITLLKKYGIRPESTEAAELIHAAGGKKYVPVGVIRQGARPFQGLAAEMAEMELTQMDEWGRPDESAALEAIVEALRGRG